MAEYIWAAGCRITKKTAEPQVVGELLDAVQHEHGGRITAKIVVESARPIDSPLHPLFEWDDATAAERYREEQARHVLNSIRIVQPRIDPRKPTPLIRAYVNLEEDINGEKQRCYVPIARVLTDDDLMRQALQRAADELRAFEERYSEFEAIAAAVRMAREKIEAAA